MSAGRGRGLRPGGVVRALARLFFLVAIGFGVGLAFGVVLEEPGLLADHLRGRSESVELAGAPGEEAAAESAVEAATPAGSAGRPIEPAAASTDAQALPRVAAPGPAPERIEAPVEHRPPARPRPMIGASLANERPVADPKPSVPESVPTAASGASERAWAIQVGAFAEAESANRLAAGLRDRYPVAVLPASGAGGRWRVRIQPIEGADEARSLAERLKREERLPTWVTRMEGRSGS